MKRRYIFLCAVFVFLCSVEASALSFGDVRGVVVDPQRRPVAGASVLLHSRTSDFSLTAKTDSAGYFIFRAVQIGEYSVAIESRGFNRIERVATVVSDSAPVLEFVLEIAPVTQSVEVTVTTDTLGSDSPTPTTLVNRRQIAETPGADRTNSLAFITDYVPGAYVTHNQLHIRGGHQVSWLVDGVPVPNTNIADTVGPQFDPKDIDYMEVQRGGYSAEYGDRTYGVFNVVPRSGFERDREADILLSYGNFNQTNEQLSFGGHTKRFAYYASMNGNRSDYGLETPIAKVLHDQSNGFGGFTSLIFNATPKDQLRLAASFRRDYFQVPNDQDAEDNGIRDAERERDFFLNFSWVHTFNTTVLLTVSPFYHYNNAAFIGGPNDTPLSTNDLRSSQYGGAQVVLSALTRRNNAKAGFYGFFQRDSAFFSVAGLDGNGNPVNFTEQNRPRGNQEVAFVEDQLKPSSWLTLTGGVRFTRFQGALTESATSPRLGAAIRIPRVNFVVHGFYGRFFQAPPLSTLTGPLLQFALTQGVDFIPLKGERDEEYLFGLSVPVKGWSIDTDYFHTAAKNFFDHDALGNSSIFFPLTIDRALIRGFEATLHSPQLFKHLQVYLAYSRQRALGAGAVSGGLTDFSPPQGFFFLDHDQRTTLSSGFNLSLPRRTYVAGNLRYGSGFVDGDGPNHLPGHATFDLSAGKAFRENWNIAIQSVNLTNSRYLLDNSNTFGGTHFDEPRQVYVELRYRFHY